MGAPRDITSALTANKKTQRNPLSLGDRFTILAYCVFGLTCLLQLIFAFAF